MNATMKTLEMAEDLRMSAEMAGSKTCDVTMYDSDSNNAYAMVFLAARSRKVAQLAAASVFYRLNRAINQNFYLPNTEEVPITSTSNESFYAGVIVHSNGEIRFCLN